MPAFSRLYLSSSRNNDFPVSMGEKPQGDEEQLGLTGMGTCESGIFKNILHVTKAFQICPLFSISLNISLLRF